MPAGWGIRTLKCLFGHLFIYHEKFSAQFPVTTATSNGSENHFLRERITPNGVSRRRSELASHDKLLSRINAAHFLFFLSLLRVMPSNDPPQNVDEDNRGEVADSQQDFKKPQEHKKCNLPTTPMRSKTAIPRVHVRNMRLKCRKDSKMRALSLSLSPPPPEPCQTECPRSRVR